MYWVHVIFDFVTAKAVRGRSLSGWMGGWMDAWNLFRHGG